MEVAPPKHCPGVASDEAGKANACAGCPNQKICSSGDAKPTVDILMVDRLLKIKHIILVISGKGGTGKSTISTMLARAIACDPSIQVGLLDLDICGPSIPRMFDLETEQVYKSTTGWTPVYVQDNLAVMSCGFLLDSLDDAIIWRGPKKNTMIRQFLTDVEWGNLDYLVIDTPPGTSDEHISLVQYIKQTELPNLDGAVMVTTPQEVSLMDVRKQIDFCNRIGVKILGLIENMGKFNCPKCSRESVIFPSSYGGVEKMASDYNLEIIGRLPLNPLIGRHCDSGESLFEDPEDSIKKPLAQAFISIKNKIMEKVAKI